MELLQCVSSKDKQKARTIQVNFALAYDGQLRWVRSLLES